MNEKIFQFYNFNNQYKNRSISCFLADFSEGSKLSKS